MQPILDRCLQLPSEVTEEHRYKITETVIASKFVIIIII